MISPKLRTFIYILMAFLVILDLVLSTTCLFFPERWFAIFHGVAYMDPQALLKRTGAVWVAFTLLQLIAFFRWEKAPWWLILIAGVRLTELFSDWTYMWLASNMTSLGRLGLFIAPPGNLVFGIFLIWAYKKVMKARDC
jgi:hypothetical protein